MEGEEREQETPHRALGRVFYQQLPLPPSSKPCRRCWLVIAATVTLPATQGSGEGLSWVRPGVIPPSTAAVVPPLPL